ncbi:hypothetical protein XarbCFBP8150_21770, partial [Xanthomonas arboricola]
FIAAPVLVDAMRPSLYAPLSLLACTALALSACKPGDKELAQRGAGEQGQRGVKRGAHGIHQDRSGNE